MRIFGWIARVLLALLFLFAGGMKLVGGAEAVAGFERLGFGQWFRVFIGACEVSGGVGLLLPPFAGLAAALLAVVMVGALASQAAVLGGNPTAAVVALVLCLVVAWVERGSLRALPTMFLGKGPMDGWMARSYDGVQSAFRDNFRQIFTSLATDTAGAGRVLDAGCGPGQYTLVIAEALPGAEVWGIDLAPTMIELARGHAARSPAAARVHFEVADVARLPFRDGEFDVVMSSGSIKQWPDPVAGLRELHRVLAPGGRAVISELNREAAAAAVAAQAARAPGWFMKRIFPSVVAMAISPSELRALLGASPFGAPVAERLLQDGLVCLAEGRKAGA